MNTAKPKIQNRKAVAPIIATLLLVAIAVVGGIIVFVWASGMFGSTAGTALPNAESIQLIGYDARDVEDLAGITTADVDNTADNTLSPGEFIVFKVRNTGVADVLINKVTIMGQDHSWDSDTAGDNEAPADNLFLVYSGTSGDPSASKSTKGIAPGEDARIVVNLHEDLPSDVSLGRNLQMKIKTEQGAAFNFFVVTGQSE